jgi:predicted nucleic acid-binding protein
MTHYLDTSAFVACFDPHNPHCLPVLKWREEQEYAVTLAYNRILQLEARHYLRRLTHSHAGLAWNAFRAFEARRLYEWVKLDFSALFEMCEDLSQLHKPKLQCGFWDLCHIAGARKFDLPLVTCDVRQSQAAKVIGVKTILIRSGP